jgi:RNA polymerase sigma-54 factor
MPLQHKQTIQQRLMLAPNVTLALEVLRMPTLELRAFLEQQLEENPLLEIDEPTGSDDELPIAHDELNGHDDAALARLDEDWLAHWKTSGEYEPPEDESALEDRRLEQRLSKPASLHESLKLQLGCQSLLAEEQRLGEALIERIDEHGYLEGTLEEIATQHGASPAQLEAILKLIQQFDPPGVGARDLRECLMIQMEQAQETASLAYHILQDCYLLFTQHDLRAMAKATKTTAEEVARACERIKQLNPKPGRVFAGDLPPSIVPDLIIRNGERHYDVELNDQDIPQISVSRTYYRMLKNPRTPPDAKEFLLNKFRSAAWLIKAIEERNATLLSIARCLISLQRDFLTQGQKALKPLTQAQVAALIGRHPSTVSRAVAGKTMDTPYGIFYLEQFFASRVPQQSPAEQISDETIKSEIRRLIAEESSQHPLSDHAMVRQLEKRHISVARRTIAKYRAHLKILPAHLRKRSF